MLTILKYIRISSNKSVELGKDDLLPIIYHHENAKEQGEYCDQQGFQTLLIDTLTEHVRMKIFKPPDYLSLESPEILDTTIKNLSKGIQKTLEDHLNVRREKESVTPFRVFQIIAYLLFILLSIIMFPLVLILHYRKKRQDNDSSQSKLHLLIYILASLLLSAVVYLILINLILFHVYYDENSRWRVNVLEVYWPFALVITMIIISHIYFYDIILPDKNEQKQRKLFRIHHWAEMEILKESVQVTTKKGDSMTVAQFESKKQPKKNSSSKLQNIFIKIYRSEFQDLKRAYKILKILVFILMLAVAIVHTCIPIIYRQYFSNKKEPSGEKPFQVNLIEISYFIIGLPLYLIYLFLMIYAFYKYANFYRRIDKLLRKITNDHRYVITEEDQYYFNLKKPDNLDLFLALLKTELQKINTVEYQVKLFSVIIRCDYLFFD